ncbi:hypothetical protein SMICM17S_03784 [Streptomyces microflavus]
MNKSIRCRALTGTVLALATATVLTACGGESASSADTESDKTVDATPAVAVKEPLVATFDGGLYILDGESLKLAKTIDLPGFNRVNPAGDKDHVMVSTDSGFRVLDATDQALTDIEYKGAKPGHVVRHAAKTVLFTDGTGEVNVFDPTALSSGKKPSGRTYTSAEAHHGVAIELADGKLVSTLGTEEKRTGALVLDRNNKEIARSEDCPGVHGEAAAKNEAVGVGCEDGILIYKDGTFTKIDSPDDYGRIGNQAGSDTSPVLLGDYKTDPDAELERPTRVTAASSTPRRRSYAWWTWAPATPSARWPAARTAGPGPANRRRHPRHRPGHRQDQGDPRRGRLAGAAGLAAGPAHHPAWCQGKGAGRPRSPTAGRLRQDGYARTSAAGSSRWSSCRSGSRSSRVACC